MLFGYLRRDLKLSVATSCWWSSLYPVHTFISRFPNKAHRSCRSPPIVYPIFTNASRYSVSKILALHMTTSFCENAGSNCILFFLKLSINPVITLAVVISCALLPAAFKLPSMLVVRKFRSRHTPLFSVFTIYHSYDLAAHQCAFISDRGAFCVHKGTSFKNDLKYSNWQNVFCSVSMF